MYLYLLPECAVCVLVFYVNVGFDVYILVMCSVRCVYSLADFNWKWKGSKYKIFDQQYWNTCN